MVVQGPLWVFGGLVIFDEVRVLIGVFIFVFNDW